MNKIFICLAIALLPVNSNAQVNVKVLHIGDQMPDYSFPSVINVPETTINLQAYKGKFLILDFWNTACSSCLEGFPHMQDLQNKFQDKLKIILVNTWKRDTKEAIERALMRISVSKGTKIGLPVALYDSTFSNSLTQSSPYATSYFPFQTLPHEVIIDSNGKVFAITSLEEITEANVEKMVAGNKVNFADRDYFLNYNIPLILNKSFLEKGNDAILMNASLTGYSTAVANNEKFNWRNERVGQSYTNVPLIFLYTIAYQKMIRKAEELIFETKNPLFQNPDQDPLKLFCYDLILPSEQYSSERLAECLKQDLDRTFGFNLYNEKRFLPCLIIKTNKKIVKSYSKSSKRDEGSSIYIKDAIKNHISVFAHGLDVSYIPSRLLEAGFINAQKAIDESGDKHFVDIDFPLNFNFSNFHDLREFLASKGIELSIEYRELNCVIISDKK
jgi:thiol-disulfide isomerase/thioredoxin